MDKRSFIKTGGLMAGAMMFGVGNLFVNSSCNDGRNQWPKGWMWLHSNMKRTDEEWNELLKKLADAGITGILIGGGVEMLNRIIPLAAKFNIDVHAWMWTLNRPGDKEAQQHPDWYTVSRKGDSCFDVHPYVDYYQWVCPSKEEVFQHISRQVAELAAVPGLKGVHLDYVRYSDVILAKALQPVYNLVQDKEYPEFDFCYCDTCREKFLAESGIDIRTLEDPTQSAEWRQYRYDSVTRLVNRLVETAHNKGTLITAAVFPYPEISRTICRQSWDEWNLDAVFPMIYQNFYDEPVSWIGESARKGVTDLKGKRPLFAGLYLPELTGDELSVAINDSMKAGAAGIAVFDEGSAKEEHYQAFVNAKKLLR
jgi:uncharacterized lipoprotein YddW (UPF0748 family)